MSKLRIVTCAVFALALLAGCSSTYTDHERDGGITPEAAEQALEAIDGITSARYSTEEWYSPGEGGLFSSEGMDIYLEVTIDDEHSIADPEQFLDYLARTAWSVNDHYPKGHVLLVITGGIAHYYDWLPVVNAVFGTDLTYLSDYSGSAYGRDWGEREVPISVAAQTYGDRFGTWPSEEVDIPTGLLLDEPPVFPVVAALTDISFRTQTPQPSEEDCYTVHFVRGVGYDGPYVEPVQVELLSSSGAVIETHEIDGNYSYTSFCFDDGERPSGAQLHITAEELEWYSGIDETLSAD